MTEAYGEPIREAVGVFTTRADFHAAIDDLLSSGFDRADLSLMAPRSAVETTLGHPISHIEDAEDDASVPRRAYVSPDAIGDAKGWLIGGLFYVGAVAAAGAIVASGGTLAGAIVAAGLAGGSGGLFGSALGRFLEDRHADYLRDQLDRGGILLWVRCRDQAHEVRACGILAAHSAHDVHVHALTAG